MAGRAVDVSIEGGPTTFARNLNNRSSWAKSIEAGTKRAMESKLRALEQEVVEEVERRVDELYFRRSGQRHKKGTKHLHGSFRCQIDIDTFPMKLRVWSTADPEKVAALNYGASAHTIRGKNGKKGMLWFPRQGLGESGAYYQTSHGRPVRGGAGGGGRPTPRVAEPARFRTSPGGLTQASNGSLTRRKVVKHPGIKPSYFMEIALEQAVESVLRKHVRLARR